MARTKNIFASGISIDQLIAQFGKRTPRKIAFLIESSCVDTWPPIPGGGGK
ncbi:MAG TPA: hypothetical protein VF487_13630 [Chitinophagaceae bacterium]